MLSQHLLLAQRWSDILQIQNQQGGPRRGARGVAKEEGATEKAVRREFEGGEVVGRGEWPMAHSVSVAEADGRVAASSGMDLTFQLVIGVNGSFCENGERGQDEMVGFGKHRAPHLGLSLLCSIRVGALELETVICPSWGTHHVSQILILWPSQHYKCGRVGAVVFVQTEWPRSVLCLRVLPPRALLPGSQRNVPSGVQRAYSAARETRTPMVQGLSGAGEARTRSPGLEYPSLICLYLVVHSCHIP